MSASEKDKLTKPELSAETRTLADVRELIRRKQRLFEPNEAAYNALVQLGEEVDDLLHPHSRNSSPGASLCVS